jgi:hypothetical protein
MDHVEDDDDDDDASRQTGQTTVSLQHTCEFQKIDTLWPEVVITA